MICVAIKGPTYQDAEEQIKAAMAHADLVELRLDGFQELDLAALQKLMSKYSIPFLFTLRDRSQGGFYLGREESRLKDLELLAELEPDYLDIESHVPRSFVEEISRRHPKVKAILSYHDFSSTPEDLDALFKEMKKSPAHFYKIAAMAQSTSDMLRMLLSIKVSQGKLIGISMGEDGMPSRILGAVVGCPMTYACLDETQQTAPGQISAHVLKEVYHYKDLNSKTTVYGLIGDPIEQSISQWTHNAFFRALDWNAVYVKMLVRKEELGNFFELIKQLPFRGLSVTIPHKEHVMEYVDDVEETAQQIGAVNTLLIDGDGIRGINTDGIGALNPIERHMKVLGKRLILLGAGGSAKAIAYEAAKRGARLIILNRHEDGAKELASHFGAEGGGLDLMKQYHTQGYDILINSTSVDLPIDPHDLCEGALVMDVKTKPMDNPLLRAARERGCPVVYGYEMFVEQALGQFAFWFPSQFDLDEVRYILEEESLRVLSHFQ